MIVVLIAGALLAAFSAAILLHAIPTGAHHYVSPGREDRAHPKILGAHFAVSGAWSIAGLIAGLFMVALYFML